MSFVRSKYSNYDNLSPWMFCCRLSSSFCCLVFSCLKAILFAFFSILRSCREKMVNWYPYRKVARFMFLSSSGHRCQHWVWRAYGGPSLLDARSAFHYLWLVRQLVPYLNFQDLAPVTHAMVTSRLHYCNSLYMGLSLNLNQKLQQVQNVAVHMLTALSVQMNSQTVLQQFQWLPTECLIRFQVLRLHSHN